MPTARALTDKQARFCEEYLVDLNATQAALRAGYSLKSAKEIGSQLLGKPLVAARIHELQAQRSQRTEITVDAVLRRWWDMVTADPNELVEFRRSCCRHCYGENFEYHLTQREFDKREADWAKAKGRKPTDIFEPLGGTGFDARKPPNPECPECFGDGVGAAHFKDTRSLSAGARMLYAGVKETKEGIEIKMHSQADALTNVARHLGMFTEKADGGEAPADVASEVRKALRAIALADGLDAAT